VRLVQRLVAAGASIDGDIAGYSTLLSAAWAATARSVRMIPALVALGARETVGDKAMHMLAVGASEGAPLSDEEAHAALTAARRFALWLVSNWRPLASSANQGPWFPDQRQAPRSTPADCYWPTGAHRGE
jgi:hypothetical protein